MSDLDRVRLDSVSDTLEGLAGSWLDVEVEGKVVGQKILTDFEANAHYVDSIQRATGKVLWLRRDLPRAYGDGAAPAAGGPDVGSVWRDGYDLTKYAVEGTLVKSAFNGDVSVFAHGRWWGPGETSEHGRLPEWWMGPWLVVAPGENSITR